MLTIDTNRDGSSIKAGTPVGDRVYLFDPLSDPRWDRFLSLEPRSSVFHGKTWLLALNHTYGYEPVGYTSVEQGEEFRNAVVFCRVKSWLTATTRLAYLFRSL